MESPTLNMSSVSVMDMYSDILRENRTPPKDNLYRYVSMILQILIFVILIILTILYLTKSTQAAVISPEPSIGDKRFSLEGGRKGIPNGSFPTVLRGYTVGASTTGIYTDWGTSEKALGDMSYAIANGLIYSYHNPNTRDGKLARLIAEDFILLYSSRLKEVGVVPNRFPWGHNWYEFSVSSTMMMAYYLLLPNPGLIDIACETILSLITSPTVSLGWPRDGPNALYLTGPYLLAKYYRGEVEEVFTTSDYKKVEEAASLPLVRTQGMDGLHLDNTYLYHSGLVGYSYLSTLSTILTNYTYGLDIRMKNPLEKLNEIKSFVLHPTIPISSMGLSGRSNDLKSDTYSGSPMGIKVFPFQRYIRYFTDKYQFSMRGQVPWLFFYEADHTNYKQSQYWVQFRNVNTKQTSPSLKFPDAGFICSSAVTQLIETPSIADTTYGYTTPTADSFVFAYGKYGVLWQQYEIQEFGPQKVTELVVIDSKKNLITIDLIIESSTSDVVYYSSLNTVSIDNYRNSVSPLPVNGKTHYQTVFNLNAGTVGTKLIESTADMLPLRLEDGISVYQTTKYNILAVSEKPKILSLKTTKYELDSIIADDGTFFSFDKVANQYIAQ